MIRPATSADDGSKSYAVAVIPFPLCELWCPRCTYAQHLALFTDELGLTPAEQEAILGGTAEWLWF